MNCDVKKLLKIDTYLHNYVFDEEEKYVFDCQL